MESIERYTLHPSPGSPPASVLEYSCIISVFINIQGFHQLKHKLTKKRMFNSPYLQCL